MARPAAKATGASALAGIVRDGLNRYNRERSHPIRYRRLVLSVREGKRIVGGLVGDFAWNSAYVGMPACCGWTRPRAGKVSARS
ncbi:MAG: hypothetical protein ACT4P3_16540 [Betaproteobacteria bacterium]